MDVSRATVHKWLARYHAEGEAGLEDRSARPHRQPARLSPAREQAICDRRRRTRSRAFRAVLTRARVAQERHPRVPAPDNGKAERFNLTLKHKWSLRCRSRQQPARLDDLLARLHHYNDHGPTRPTEEEPHVICQRRPAKHRLG